MLPPRYMVSLASLAALLWNSPPLHAQSCSPRTHSVSSGGLSSSQVDELDREGALIAGLVLRKPAIECPDILDRVARSQHSFLDRNSNYYVMLPNGDAINAYRGLRLREIEDQMRLARGNALERLEREFHELAPGGEHLICDEDGTPDYRDQPPVGARAGETVYIFEGLPPMHEMPVRPHADTLAAHPIFGSRLEEHRHNDFHIDQQTDHWLIGHTVIEGRCTGQRIAVLRDGARITGTRLERSCVLWPLNRTAEGRRDYWDRAPIPLYVALNADDFRTTPAELACAAERGQVMLRNYAVRSDRSRPVTVDRGPSNGSGFVRKTRTHGAWQHRVIWRDNHVTLMITDPDTHADRRARQIEREDRQPDGRGGAPRNEDDDAADAATHTLELRDGRTMRGRLLSDPGSRTIEFVVVVGTIEQRMSFPSSKVKRITRDD